MRVSWGVALLTAVLVVATTGTEAGGPRPCGPGFSDCPPWQFCRAPDGTCDALLEGVCTDFPADCPAVFDPVCGCDEVTYDNECLALSAGVSILDFAPCVEDLCGGQACAPDEFCQLPEGSCFDSPQEVGNCTQIPAACTQELDPVCGCDNVTYTNACHAAAASVSINYQGACTQTCGGFGGTPCDDATDFCYLWLDGCCCDLPGSCLAPPTECPDTCTPVCGCDQLTYDNRCQAEAAPTNVLQEAACEEVRDLEFFAPDEMTWSPPLTPPSSGFNVYRAVRASATPGPWECLLADVQATTAVVPGAPPAGTVWFYGVTALVPGGEGPLGTRSTDCSPRIIETSCQSQTHPASWQ